MVRNAVLIFGYEILPNFKTNSRQQYVVGSSRIVVVVVVVVVEVVVWHHAIEARYIDH